MILLNRAGRRRETGNAARAANWKPSSPAPTHAPEPQQGPVWRARCGGLLQVDGTEFHHHVQTCGFSGVRMLAISGHEVSVAVQEMDVGAAVPFVTFWRSSGTNIPRFPLPCISFLSHTSNRASLGPDLRVCDELLALGDRNWRCASTLHPPAPPDALELELNLHFRLSLTPNCPIQTLVNTTAHFPPPPSSRQRQRRRRRHLSDQFAYN